MLIHDKMEINFLVTDLDDTIWDWLNMWYKSFEPFLERISKETNINKELLIADFKALHQKYGTTEMSFLYKELPCIDESLYYLFEESIGKSKSIMHEYNSNKKHNLKAYDGVIDTLKKIKSRGTKIVAFTESNIFFTKYRIKHLGLDSIIDAIYSPVGHDLPDSVYRHYPIGYWNPKTTVIRDLPRNTRKPDVKILETILIDSKANKHETIYIGDKLDRDIYMANQAGITSVYARYGHIIDDRYDLLRKVTHWSEKDVEREKLFRENGLKKTIADYTVDSFNDLTSLFTFKPFINE